MEKYSTIDIEKALGINRERFRAWMSKGYIKPSIPSPGQGRRAEFTKADILRVVLFEELLNIGFKRENAAEIIKDFEFKAPTSREVMMNFLILIIRDGEISIQEIADGVHAVVDLGDEGKRKLIASLPDGGMSFLPLHSLLPESKPEAEFDHLHIVNLKKLIARVDIAFPE